MRPLRFVIVAALGLSLVPATASARTQQQTYPVATRLCARADAGKLPKRLAASSDQVKAACAALTTAYTAAQSDFTTATASLTQQTKDAIATARTTCKAAIAAHDRTACQAAVATERQTLSGLRDQRRTATQAYRTALGAARKAFWTTIHGLPGGAGLTADHA